MASHTDSNFLVDSEVGVHKIHFKRVDKYRSSFLCNCPALSCPGADSGTGGLCRFYQIAQYSAFSDLAFDRSNFTIISQHNVVFACSESFNRSSWELEDSGSNDHRFKPVCMDHYFYCISMAYSDNLR